MKLEPLRSDIYRALLTAALAPIFSKIIGALFFYVAALLWADVRTSITARRAPSTVNATSYPA